MADMFSFNRTFLGAGLLMVSAIFTSCSGESEPVSDGVRHLLSHKPSSQVSTDSKLIPTRLNQWGRHDGGGWAPGLKGPDKKGRYSVLMSSDAATIELAATGANDRELRLTARASAPHGTVHLTMNEVPLATLELKRDMSTSTVAVPSAFWRTGRNRLTITRDAELDESVKIFVAEIDLSPAAEVKQAGDHVTLDPGTEVAWRFELASPAVLDIRMEAGMEGLATIALESIDPSTGSVQQLRNEEIQVSSHDPAISRIPVPDPEGNVLQVRISWTGNAGELVIKSIDLIEKESLYCPPILFVSIDTLSAQNLSVYGYGRPTTPNLAAFAKDSVLFETARSNAPWTIPSYASQFTGVYSWANKREKQKLDVPHFAWDSYRVPERRWTMGEMLRGVGYTTGAFVDNLWLARVPGFSQGFDVYNTDAAIKGRVDPNAGMRMIFPMAKDFLEAHRGKRVFVFAQVVDVHGPYLPDPPFKGRFSGEIDASSVTELPVVRASPTVFGGIPEAIARGRFDDDEALPPSVAAEYYQADYDEKILEMDSVLGEFFDDLKESGLYDDLLIIFSADHGESMVDHDFYFRHGIAYDSAIHVPLIIKMPAQAHAGTRVTSPVQLVDLYPTIMDIIGLSPERGYLHGRSILRAIENGSIEDTALMSQSEILEHCALTLGRWKLIKSVPKGAPLDSVLSSPAMQRELYKELPESFLKFFGQPPPIDPNRILEILAGLEVSDPDLHHQIDVVVRHLGPVVELYDTDADPSELHDLSEENPDVVTEMLELMQGERLKAEQMRIDDHAPEIRLNDEMLDELRSLGYVGDD